MTNAECFGHAEVFILCVVDHQIEMFVCNAGLVSAVSKVILKVEIEAEDG